MLTFADDGVDDGNDDSNDSDNDYSRVQAIKAWNTY